MTNKLLSASSINDKNVKNTSGEDLGNIKELMMNTNKGTISYAVLSFGGFLGIGDKYFAIPWEAFSFSKEDDDCLILNVPKEKLDNAPGFDKENWPEHAKDTYLTDVYTHYGYPRNW